MLKVLCESGGACLQAKDVPEGVVHVGFEEAIAQKVLLEAIACAQFCAVGRSYAICLPKHGGMWSGAGGSVSQCNMTGNLSHF